MLSCSARRCGSRHLRWRTRGHRWAEGPANVPDGRAAQPQSSTTDISTNHAPCPCPAQLEAQAAAERAGLERHARTQEGLRQRADIGMHEAAAELAVARQAESTLRVDLQAGWWA